MGSRNDIGSGEIEWLDVGPVDPPDPGGRPRRGRRPWYLLAAAAAVIVLLVAALNHNPKHHTATATRHPTTASAPSTSTAALPSDTPSDTPSSTPPPVSVRNTGAPLLDVPPGWQLFARGPNTLVRIELARGRITQTAVPELENSGGGLSFVVGRDRAIIQTMDIGTGYVVRDGRPAQELPAAFGQHGPVLPGPDPDHVWVPSGTGPQSVVALVGFDGRRAGPTIRVPDGVGSAESDAAGYVRFYGTGGAYDARPDGVKRITSGDLLAIGPTRWLTEECDAEFRCATVVTDRASGARHTIATSSGNYSYGGFSSGVISPDGTLAAITQVTGQDPPKLSLLDLSTGDVHTTAATLNPDQAFSGGVMQWSPDSRWLFIAADAGRLAVLDRRSMRITALGANLPFLDQIAFRAG